MLRKTDKKALDNRCSKRTKMVVGLRVPQEPSPQEPSHSAGLLVHTLDISPSGARIGALREGMQPGSALILQRKHTRVHCRVMWSRKLAPGEIQIGIKFVARDFCFWGLDLDDDCVGVWSAEGAR